MCGIPINLYQSFSTGDGKYFVLEGDEYDSAFFDKESKFLHYKPTIAVWTSLEYDHADIFLSMEKLEGMFKKFLQLIPHQGGRLIYCQDWARLTEIVEEHKKQ